MLGLDQDIDEVARHDELAESYISFSERLIQATLRKNSSGTAEATVKSSNAAILIYALRPALYFCPETILKNMFNLKEDQLEMRELHIAAYHEAGHKTIYRRFGGAGNAVVCKRWNRGPDEPAWAGQFRPRTCPQTMHDVATRHGMPAAELPDNWRTLYGMAGLVAEEILRGETDPNFVAGALDIKIACGEVSASDLKSMGITNIADFELNSEEVEQAWRFLLEDWSLVQEEAEYLIAEALEQQLHHRQAYSPNVIVKCCP